MIAFDTNAIIRIVTEDDETQANKVKNVIQDAEVSGHRVLILSEVLIETVWVLESVYECNRDEIAGMIENLLMTPTFYMPEATVIHKAVKNYKKGGDFADMLIVYQAKRHQAENLFSFDKKLQKYFPDFVTEPGHR